MELIYYPKCSTCKNALKILATKGIQPKLRDIVLETPTKEELKQLHEKSNVDIQKFFNTSGLKYKALNLKEKLKDYSLEEKYALLASDGMLIKRPILVTADQVLVGTNHPIYKE